MKVERGRKEKRERERTLPSSLFASYDEWTVRETAARSLSASRGLSYRSRQASREKADRELRPTLRATTVAKLLTLSEPWKITDRLCAIFRGVTR